MVRDAFVHVDATDATSHGHPGGRRAAIRLSVPITYSIASRTPDASLEDYGNGIANNAI